MPNVTSGRTYNRLTALHDTGERRSGRKPIWAFQCVCGARVVADAYKVAAGSTQSCGCQRKDNGKARRTHGEASAGGKRTPEYTTWAGIRNRCENPENQAFQDYGGRSISVCARWAVYENFLEDMGRRPSPHHSIDRIDNDGNYEPGNCHWATMAEQSSNTRAVRRITIGPETRHLAEWLRHFGVTAVTFHNRVRAGMSEVEALSKPTWKTLRAPDKHSRATVISVLIARDACD